MADIRVEVESEGGCAPNTANVKVYDGEKLVAEVLGRVELKRGADGGWYHCVELKEAKETYSCLLCGTTTPLPHVCPVFYPERQKS